MRIGIYGGTFDPIHVGHLITAEYARELLALDQLHFVVAAVPPHKTGLPITPAEDRFEMVRRAVASNPHFLPSDVEIRRGGRSFTVDTLRELRQSLGVTREELVFLMGQDSLADFATWRQPERILELATVVAFRRPNVPLDGVPEVFLQRIRLLETPLIEISATEIRRRVREGRSIRYLVPDEVAEYIRQRGLYR